MTHLHDDLETIRQFNELRERTKELRQQGLRPLQKIKAIEYTTAQQKPPKVITKEPTENKIFDKWFSSGNEVEVSLLAKVQNHQELSLNEKDNNKANATADLIKRLTDLSFEKTFFPKNEEVPGIRLDSLPTVPVLMSARVMQTLVNRAETVFSKSTMLCYYRIVREFFTSVDSDDMLGAARAGAGAPTSAFVTGECVHAILGFQDAIKRTIKYYENTCLLYQRFRQLNYMLGFLGIESLDAEEKEKHPLYIWANRAIERMWLDCYIATNPRGGHIALYNELEVDEVKVNGLLLNDQTDINLKTVEEYFGKFAENLKNAINRAKEGETTNDEMFEGIEKAKEEIERYRENEIPLVYISEEIRGGGFIRKQTYKESYFDFVVSDFKNASDLDDKITKGKDELSKFLKKELNLSQKKKSEEETAKQLKDGFNRLLPQAITGLYEHIKEEKIALNNEAKKILKEYQESENKSHNFKQFRQLNRLLLEVVFPLDLVENQVKSKVDDYHNTEGAHLKAFGMIEDALEEIENSLQIIDENETDIDSLLKKLIIQAERISHRIHLVAEATPQFFKKVIRRELDGLPSMFDAGELVFAATAFGALTDWKSHELLKRSCDKLKESLPENGRLLTKRPLHSTQRGYRLLPIGCEMTRRLAQLFQKTNYDIDPQLVDKMLNLFEEKIISVSKNKGKEMLGWNFDGSPNPTKPCVWVSSVAVLALDRIVRMLNSKINNSVFKHFAVFQPEKPHVMLTLNDLIYSDAGFSEYFYKKNSDKYENLLSIPITLELMRAHLMRATLPMKYVSQKYRDAKEDGNSGKGMIDFPSIFSAIFYGPPGTGKTTLAEALALSSNVPVILLSPNDLLVEGQELMEGRVRDVFEALSMLTQTVIILDEFESILESRSFEPAKGIQEDLKGSKNVFQKGLLAIAEEIKELSKKEDPKFQFLLGGMLPRLLKLYDVAKNQSLVYCLATNYLKKIDHAAKRTGRFDLKIPVYNPDPPSRAGTLIFRLSRILESLQKKRDEDQKKDRTATSSEKPLPKWDEIETWFKEVLAHTTNEPASELSGRYFKIKDDGEETKSKSRYLDYILSNETAPTLEYDKAEKMNELLKNQTKLEEIEIKEIEWLKKLEEKLVEKDGNNGNQPTSKELPEILKLN